uniref:UNC80 domain-containing protein n=1 Tax=Haemonchus contortus TaxID=6289 RepID=A0A7I4YUG5_HAECO
MHVRYLQHQHQGTVQLLLMPLSTAASSMKSTKWVDDGAESECEAVPLPIQTFLWRQTNPFLGAKVGKLHEASCVTLERVVVQNILHGLSPSLSDAIASVSRWKLIRAALPHVVQCCGSLLESADGRGLSTSLQKILYILHWMLLDSAAECAENSPKDEPVQHMRGQGLFSISSIQLFVYLIAPLVDMVTEEDIASNIRLESGLKIWQALWQYRQPDVWCFTAPVKPRRDELPQLLFLRRPTTTSIPQSQGIYLGEEEKPRRLSIVPPPKPPRTDRAVLDEKRRRELEKQREQERKTEHNGNGSATPLLTAPSTSKDLIDVHDQLPSPSTSASCIVRSVSEYKTGEAMIQARDRIAKSNTTNAFDMSPTSESSLQLMDEVNPTLKFAEDNNSLSGVFCPSDAPLAICELCHKPIFCDRLRPSGCQCEVKPLVTPREAPPVVLTRASTADDTASSSSQHTVIPARPPPKPSEPPPPHQVAGAVRSQPICAAGPSTSSRTVEMTGSTDDELESSCQPDPMVATILDVAVIRALLITHWQEQGIYWAMRYLLNRLEQIQNHIAVHGIRNRSNSLPSGERKPSISIGLLSYSNTTWENFQLKREEEDRTKLHVAFNDSRRKSSDQACMPFRGHHSRRASLNTLTRRDRNRSDPSLNNSCEILSIREDSASVSNASSKGSEKANSKFYPEALGSSSYIEKNGRLSLTVVVQTVNQVMERNGAVRLCELALNIAETLLRIPIDQTETFFAQLTVMTFRIYLSLGCPHGCNEGVKSQQGDFLRVKAKSLLANLEKLQQDRFRTIFANYVEENSPQQILDLIHSITAFCRSEFPQEARRQSESKAPSYRNRFNEREKGIEGRIINATLRDLSTKLARIQDQLIEPENMSLLGDVRMLVNFIQEQHGNPFRRVGLSALLDAINKSPKLESCDMPRKHDESGKSSPGGLAPPVRGDQASLRRGLFRKRDKSSHDSLLKSAQEEVSDADSSPSTPRTASSIDDGLSPLVSAAMMKKKSAPKLHFAFNLLKSSRTDNMDEECSDSETADELSEIEYLTAKRPTSGSIRNKPSKTPLDAQGNIRLYGILVPAPRTLDNKGIFEGVRRFAFLLETTRPGTFPDPPLIAALLHLKSPVLARAALLLECCHFVSRCNRGQWPEWIRSSHHRTLSLGGPLANRGTPSGTRRMHSLQRTAGRYFYQWAIQIGDQLSRLIDIKESKEKAVLKMEDSMEDFFDDAIVNDVSGEKCPPALQLIATLLLYEITSFLRETFRTIPRAKNNKAAPSTGWDKLLSHRRWSILSNTFNAQQTGSVSSVVDVNSSMHLNERERRISLSTAEEDSPRGSKDTIDDTALDKKGVRPPSLSVRLFSRQSTHDGGDSGSSTTHGSTKSTTYVPESGSFGRRIAAGRQRLLKRGSPMGQQPSLESSHRRRSLRTRKQSKMQSHQDDIEERVEVLQASTGRESLKPSEEPTAQSPTEITNPMQSHGSSQQGSAYGTSQPPPKSQFDDEEQQILSNLPWIKVVIRMANSFDMTCSHEVVCTPRCFQRVSRQCHRLTMALTSLYGHRREVKTKVDKRKLLMDHWQSEQQALRRSIHSRQSAAVPRRESALVGPNSELGTSKVIKAMLMEKMMQEKEREKEREKEEGVHKKISVEQDRQSDQTFDEPEENANKPMLDYIRTLVLNLVHSPLSAVLKSCLLLSPEHYKQLIEVSWQLLLDEDPHVVLSSASMLVAACVRRPEDVVKVVRKSLESKNVTERTEAIQRFYALWRNRFHVWLKMEEGAQASFKVPPPGIDFTLPSPPIGQSQLPVVDPPWMPHLKTKIEELSLKEEEHATSQTIMTMTRTRRKQKQEMVKRAVRDAEERHCEQRQLFRLRCSAIVQQAAYEPALFHHQEQGEESEISHHPARHPLPVAQPLFPSPLLAVIPLIIEMLDDPQVDKNGVSVGDVSRKVIWTCIVEDPSLFFRHFLEKLTNRERQTLSNEYHTTASYEYLMSLLRKLILRFNPLPSQAAYSLLNYLFGFVMHYVRAQCEGSDKALGMALSLTWILAPNVHGLYFKDLKQTLKKEQCDQALMITANVPSAKKIIVHGPDSGLGGIPSQFPVHEDTQFQQILSDSIEFFNIDENEVNSYFLTDAKTGVLHLPSCYIRDFYFFHRSFYPQLSLVKLDMDEAQLKMRETAFAQRFIEVGKVLLTHNILKYSPQHVIAQRVFFLHDELTHLPSFPRKSLETCFGMFHGEMGEQLKAMEAMHKFTWAKLMSDMFEKMENAFMFADLHLFINVVNGIMIMHCEDLLILRRCAATYIAMSIHFNSLFASQGFFLIMPTLLRCYSQRQTNRVFCSVVEFLCRQFYTLHRKPFLLQMCGSIANIIDNNNNDFEINPMRVKAKYWFTLLKNMENMGDETDQFDILGLVPYDKPLKALDLCYRDDPNTFCLLTDAIASCICVCAFAPESKRSHHMLLVMAALQPHLIRRIEEETMLQNNSHAAVKHEVTQWTTMCVEMKALINSCDVLARGPQRAFDLVNTVSERGKSFVADSPQFFDPPTTNEDENSRPYHVKEKKSVAIGWEAADVEESHKESYRRSRDTLLCLAAQFIEMATPRLKELAKLSSASEHTKIPEVMDHKCHVKLSEIALALLKIASYDLTTMSCLGLQKYFTTIMPVTDWSIESNRSALGIILKRLDKTIAKIAKRQSIRRRVNWAALASWIKGICDTLSVFPYMAHLNPLKSTTQLCLRIIAGDTFHEEGVVASHPTTVLHSSPPPPVFCNAVLRMTIILMQALGQASFSLEMVSGVEGLGAASERVEAVLCHLLIPLFLRTATNPKEASIIQGKDLTFCLSLMQHAISPPAGKHSTAPLANTSTLATSFIRGAQHDISGRQGSVSVTDRGHSATVSTLRIVRDSVSQCIYLALKVMMLCFGKLLTPMWPRVARLVKDLISKKQGGQSAYQFIDFVFHAELPIALLILPVIQNRVKQKPTCEQDAIWQAEIVERMESKNYYTMSLGAMLHKCQIELTQLKEDLACRPLDLPRSYTPTATDQHSDSSAASIPARKDRRASTRKHAPIKETDEGTIFEDIEDEGAESSQPSSSRVTKSPSVPLNKITTSPRTRSISGFGMWRSIRRKSRHISTESESDGDRSLELVDVQKRDDPNAPNRTPVRRLTEAFVLPLHETLDANRQRYVSFSTPKKQNGRSDDDVFQITEQHQLV